MPGKLTHRLTASDAAFLYLERPHTPLHIGSLAIYEGCIPFERFVAQIDSRMPLIPRYRQRVVFVPFSLAHPTWEDDPEFDIRNQIHQVSLPPPGTDEQLRELTARLFAPPLDRRKPLWEIYVVHGVEGGRTGIVSKVHHCMVDGVSGIELLVATLDIGPEPAAPPDAEPWNPKPLPNLGDRLANAFWDGMDEQRQLWQELQETLINPRPRLKQTVDAFQALRTALPWLALPARRAPFNMPIGAERRVAFSEMSFVEIREIRTSLGGTVNDVVLAILAGALRKYFLLHGQSVGGWDPRVAIPVNVRLEDEQGALGNRISTIVTTLPIGEADPAARLNAVQERCGQLKKDNQAAAVEMLIRMASLTPVPLQALAGVGFTNTLFNLICTNVPGPMIPLYSVGHLLLAHYPLVPLSLNLGLGVGVTSYNQRLYFGLMADPKAVPDLERLKQCVDESFLELRAAAGVEVSDLPRFVTQIPMNGGAAVTEAAAVEGAF